MEEEQLKDKILICVECNEEFVFTVAAQKYFIEQGITEEPKRCKSCYSAHKKGKDKQQKENRKRPAHARNSNSFANGYYGNHNHSKSLKK